MAADEIHSSLSREYPKLTAVARTNPDGWSFFAGPPQHGIHSNRILRAVRHDPNGVTRIKLSVSSRHASVEQEINFSGDEAMLRALVDHELKLFHTHFNRY